MPTALEDIRAQLDRALGRVPADVPGDVPTLESLRAQVDRAMGRGGQPPIPRRKPELAETIEGLPDPATVVST